MTVDKKESIFMTFLQYVSLNVLGMIGLSCYILADTYFVAKGMGTEGLSALNLAIPIYSFINGLGLMIGIGGSTRYAILKSGKKADEANHVFTHSILFGLMIGVIFLLVGIFYSDRLSWLLGADNHTFSKTNIYLKTLMCFSPMFILNNILICFIRNDGSPRLSMIAMLTGSFSNVILDYIFIFPMGMGMFGAAFATGLAPIISMGVLASYFIRRKNYFKLVKHIPNFFSIKDICSLGISALITEVSSGIVIIIFNMVILGLAGNTGVAAYGIIANLSLVAVAIFTGVAQGTQPVVSSNYGQGNHKNVLKVLKYAIICSVIIAASLYLIVSLFTNQLIGIFNEGNDMELARLASEGLRLYFTAFVFVGINIISAAFFSSIERPVPSFIISILRGCIVIIPIAFIAAKYFGMTGIWISFPVTELITALTSMTFLVYYLRKHNVGDALVVDSGRFPGRDI